MNYPNNHELDNNDSWDDGQLGESEANRSLDNNEAWDSYSWRNDEAEVESYTWNENKREYFDDFNWDNQKKYFDNFRWDEDNRDVQENNWDEDGQVLDENIDDIEDINEELDDIDEDLEDRKFDENLLDSLLPKTLHEKRVVGGDAFIKPIRHILKQLMELEANDIEIGTERQGTILESRIISIEEYIIIVRNQFREIIIPIHQIVGIYSRRLPQIVILPEPEVNRDGEWDYYERPLREHCSKRIGQLYTVNTLARDEIFSSIKGTITKVGDGILIIDNTVAILICKIISIDKDVRFSAKN